EGPVVLASYSDAVDVCGRRLRLGEGRTRNCSGQALGPGVAARRSASARESCRTGGARVGRVAGRVGGAHAIVAGRGSRDARVGEARCTGACDGDLTPRTGRGAGSLDLETGLVAGSV